MTTTLTPPGLFLVAALSVAVACGTRLSDDDAAPSDGGSAAGADGGAQGGGGGGSPILELPVPTLLFERADGCGEQVPVEEAEAALRPSEAGEGVVAVELAFADECTGLGGQHIVARALDGGRELWLGAHGCSFFDPALLSGPVQAGVVRYAQTAALMHTPEGACISWPGEDGGLTSDSIVRAIGVFESRADAELFASGVD